MLTCYSSFASLSIMLHWMPLSEKLTEVLKRYFYLVFAEGASDPVVQHCFKQAGWYLGRHVRAVGRNADPVSLVFVSESVFVS